MFVILSRIPPFVPLEGNLKPNNLLEKAKRFGKGKLYGPETIVFTEDGKMITGLLNGQIVSVEENGDYHKIVQIGDQTDEKICSKEFLYDLDYFKAL